MGRSGIRLRQVVGSLALVGSLLVLAGCEPLRNAPPGGGETVTQTFRYGPFTLGPGEEVQGSPSSGMPRPSGSFGLKSAKFDVVDENGTPVSAHDVHLHHIVMTTSAREDRLCPGRRERFIGAGMERTPITIWGPYAYLVGASDQWGSIYHLMNETPPGTPAKTVYIEYTLDYQPGANATNSRPVEPLLPGHHRLWRLDLRRARQRRSGQRPHQVALLAGAPGRASRCSPAATCTRAASTSRSRTGPRDRRLHRHRHLPREPASSGDHQPVPAASQGRRRPQFQRHRPLRQLRSRTRT